MKLVNQAARLHFTSRASAALVVLVLGVLSIFSVPAQAQESDRPVPDKWALVVGISQFQDSSMNLQFPAKDATDFYNYLINEGHFAKDHVRLLLNENATRENVLSQVGDKWLPRVVAPDDLVVIYISSHGSPSSMDVVGANYVVAHNTDRDQLYATGIPMNEFAQMIQQRVHTDRVVLILDACHSGAAKTASKGLIRQHNFNTDAIPLGSGQLVICSSAPDQVSWESKRYSNGVFTHHLIDSLRKNPKLNDSYNYLKTQVQTEVLADRGELQVPALKTKWTGSDLIIATVPASPRAGIPETPLKLAVKPVAVVAQAAVPAATKPIITTTVDAASALRLPRPGVTVQPVAPPVQPVAPPQAVTTAAAYGQYGSNGKVQFKILDVDPKVTGTWYTLEVQNLTAAPIGIYNFVYYLYDNGYLMRGIGGSEVNGSGNQLPPGAKSKVYFISTTKEDAILIKFDKPGWSPIRLRTSDEPGGADRSGMTEQASVPESQTSAAYGQYASNGKAQMKVIDIDPKMTGYFVTVELLNLTKEPIDPYYLSLEFYNDGYLKSTISGGALSYSAHSISSGLKSKITGNAKDAVDKLIVKFPKPGWAPITLNLK